MSQDNLKNFLNKKTEISENLTNGTCFGIRNNRLEIVGPYNFEVSDLPFFESVIANDNANAKLLTLFQRGKLEYKHEGVELAKIFVNLEKVNDVYSFIKSNGLSEDFSYFKSEKAIILVDRDLELWHTNATGRFETFQTGDVITLKDGQPATLLGLELEATYDNLQILGMLSENVDTYHHDQNRADPAPVVQPIPEPVPVALPDALPARKFSVQKVIVNLCELYRNNETNVIEQADFKRRFDRQTDPLVKMEGFNAKHLYADPASVKSFLLNIPHADKVAMAANRNSLYSLLSSYHHKAQNAVEKFEYAYGPINEFCQAATEQVIAYLAFLDDKKMLGKDQLMKQGLERLEKASTMTNMNTDYTSEKFTMQDLKAHLVKSFEQIEDKKHERFKIRYKTQ